MCWYEGWKSTFSFQHWSFQPISSSPIWVASSDRRLMIWRRLQEQLPVMVFLCTQFQNGLTWRWSGQTHGHIFLWPSPRPISPAMQFVPYTSNWHMPKFVNSLHLIFSSIQVVNFDITQPYCFSMGGGGDGRGGWQKLFTLNVELRFRFS